MEIKFGEFFEIKNDQNWNFLLINSAEEDETKSVASTASGSSKPKIRNQFNFGERSAQTVNQLMRETEIQTESRIYN